MYLLIQFFLSLLISIVREDFDYVACLGECSYENPHSIMADI